MLENVKQSIRLLGGFGDNKTLLGQRIGVLLLRHSARDQILRAFQNVGVVRDEKLKDYHI